MLQGFCEPALLVRGGGGLRVRCSLGPAPRNAAATKESQVPYPTYHLPTYHIPRGLSFGLKNIPPLICFISISIIFLLSLFSSHFRFFLFLFIISPHMSLGRGAEDVFSKILWPLDSSLNLWSGGTLIWDLLDIPLSYWHREMHLCSEVPAARCPKNIMFVCFLPSCCFLRTSSSIRVYIWL